ncbi:MAG: preprotein translocase subunit SecE [Minisyncoccales bacterium]
MIEKIKKTILKIIQEAKKISWPNKREVFRYVLVILFFSFLVGLYLGLLDWSVMLFFQKFIF